MESDDEVVFNASQFPQVQPGNLSVPVILQVQTGCYPVLSPHRWSKSSGTGCEPSPQSIYIEGCRGGIVLLLLLLLYYYYYDVEGVPTVLRGAITIELLL